MGRFVPIVRTFAPIVAGIIRMDFKKFVLYNVSGALLWICSLTLLGYFLGKSFAKQIEEYLGYIIFGFIAVTTIPLVITFVRNRISRNTNNLEETEIKEKDD